MPLWLLGWARRSSKPLWKRSAKSRSGVSSVNCNEKTTMVEILLIYPSLELYHNKGIGQKLFWRFSTETLWEEMISLAKSVFLFRTLMFMRSQRLGNCCILFIWKTPNLFSENVYEYMWCRWYPLLCKPGQNKTDYRGELEVKIGFTVRASNNMGGSTADLAKKNKGSISSLNKVEDGHNTKHWT